MITFDGYLTEQCFKENPQVLDDDMPDFFERWLERLDKAQIIEYAENLIATLQK
jgi:hypothetical protein